MQRTAALFIILLFASLNVFAQSSLPWLHTEGQQIVTEDGEPILLKGYGLGGWLNWENFINGYAGTETQFRKAAAEKMGEEKAQFFFDRLIDYYLMEQDVKWMADQGFNSIRAPFNYRHFERDQEPFVYLEKGFARIDSLVKWAGKYGLYVILDLHAAQGWQNGTNPADNPYREPWLYQHKGFQDRVVGLWEEFARRYKDEPVIAGYEIFNEPATEDSAALNAFYKRVVPAIREIDPRHIIFLEGNEWGKFLYTLEAPFAENLVYTYHCYYHHFVHGERWPEVDYETAYAKFKEGLEVNTAWGRKHNVPLWAGEFGMWFRNNHEHDKNSRTIVEAQIDVIEDVGHSWALWTYKDIGKMGLLRVDPMSKYYTMTDDFHILRKKAGMYTASRDPGWQNDVREALEEALEGELDPQMVNDIIYFTMVGNSSGFHIVLGRYLAEILDQYSIEELDEMLQAWKLENCRLNEDLMNMIRKRLE